MEHEGSGMDAWAGKVLESGGDELAQAKVIKSAVLYLHRDGVDYQCDECPMFIADIERCTIHQADEVILPHGGCGYWVPGAPVSSADEEPHNLVTMVESGYEESLDGFSCKRCGAFVEGGDCLIVDKASDGDDHGEIHPDACCAAWHQAIG